MRRDPLALVLRVSSVVLFTYFTLSHWFFPAAFFDALGIREPVLDSPFLLSQLRLIGAMVAGYAASLVIIARDLPRYRPILRVVLAVGAMCTAIFVGEVAAGSLPPQFLVNAGLLGGQWLAVVALLTSDRPTGGSRGPEPLLRAPEHRSERP